MPSYPPVSEGASAAVRRQLRWTGDGCVLSPLLTPARTTRTPEQAVTPQRAQLWIIGVLFNIKKERQQQQEQQPVNLCCQLVHVWGGAWWYYLVNQRTCTHMKRLPDVRGEGYLIKLNPWFSLKSPTFFLYIPSIPIDPTFSFLLGSEWECILRDFGFSAGQDCSVELIEPFTFPIFQPLCQGVVWQRAAAPPF